MVFAAAVAPAPMATPLAAAVAPKPMAVEDAAAALEPAPTATELRPVLLAALPMAVPVAPTVAVPGVTGVPKTFTVLEPLKAVCAFAASVAIIKDVRHAAVRVRALSRNMGFFMRKL